MVGWNNQLDGHETEHTLGDSEGQECLACCSPWGRKDLDMTWGLNDYRMEKNLKENIYAIICIHTHAYPYTRHFTVHLKLTHHWKSTLSSIQSLSHVQVFATP